MDPLDLKCARDRLVEKRLNLCIAKHKHIVFETTSHGISGFIRAIEEFRDSLVGASVADRVVGKAVALLCAYSGVEAVYAMTLSENAKSMLLQRGIYVEWDALVKNVLDNKKMKVCPFEQTVTRMADPEEAYRKLRELRCALGVDEKR